MPTMQMTAKQRQKAEEEKRRKKVREALRGKVIPGGIESEAFSHVLKSLGGVMKTLKGRK